MNRRDLLATGVVVLLVLSASISLDRVFVDGSWRSTGLMAVGVALVVATLARALRVGPVGSAVASLAVFAAATYAVHLQTTGLLPGPEQWAQFIGLWEQGISAFRREPAPAPPLPGFLLMVWCGCWVVTHVAHESYVRAGRPGPALLVSAILWTVPLAVPQPPTRTWPTAIPFLLACALALFVESETDLRGVRRQRDDLRRLPVATGTVVGGIAVLIGVAIPGALPGYGEDAWLDLRSSPTARGYQPIVDVSRRLQLPEPRDLLRVRTERPVYLRLAGLDTFDGSAWRLGPSGDGSYSPADVIAADRELPPETEVSSRTPLTVTVENLGLENVFIPAPYQALRVEGPAAGRMVYSRDGAFLATSDVTEGEPALLPGMTYRVHAAVPTPGPDQLASVGAGAFARADDGRWTQLPRAYPELEALVEEIILEAGASSPSEIAFALQGFFRDPARFRYSTDVPALRGEEALTRFVVEDRLGYCEYYATAMAVMMRIAGVPARVAVGFRPGVQIDRDEYLVTSEHAHAWVEALFPGFGWITFEPTPALRDVLVPTPTELSPTTPIGERIADGSTPRDVDPAGPDEIPTREPTPEPEPAEAAADVDDRSPRDEPGVPAPWALLAIGLVLIAGAALLVMRRRAETGHLPPEERVLHAQRRLYVSARNHGVPRRDEETAHEVATRWAAEGRVEPSAAERLATLAQAAAFGGRVGHADADEADRLAGSLAGDLRASVPRAARAAAPVRAPIIHAGGSLRRAGEVARRRLEEMSGRD